MKKQFFVFPALIFIVILIFSCSKDENNSAINNDTQSIETLNRSGSVNSVADIENWFEQHLVDRIGAEYATEGLALFDIEWGNYIMWNENTFVFPMYHFVPYGRVGYTRLFVDIAEVEPEAYFYSVFPGNQDQINFDINDVINFNGELITFDIIDGYQGVIEYENGELVRYYHEDELILSRCPGCWPDWWAPREVDGGGGNDNWPWDDFWVDDGSADTGGGGVLDCYAPCPNGYPKPHPTRPGVWLNCNHQRDCTGDEFDIDIINIPESGRKIHTIGSKTTKGGGGSSGNNPPNGNPKNPVDTEGLDEVEFQQLVNEVCHYLQINNITDKDCENIALIVSANCKEEDGDILEDCIEDALEDAEEEDKSCINDHNFTRNEKQLLINLDCGYLECLASNEEMKDEVLELLDSEISDPCNPNKTTADIVNNALMSLDAECDLVMLDDAMKKIDKIVLPKLFAEKCPCFNYIFNTLTSGNADNWLCDQMQDLADSDNYTVNIEIYDNANDDPRIYTGSKNQTSTIYIPKDLCATGLMGSQEEALKASGKFIHEFLHTFYHQEFLDEYPEFDLGNLRLWRPAWNELVRKKFNIPDGEEIESNHHYLFFTELKETLMNSLWKINGEKGDPSDYEYYVNIMINVDNLAIDDQWGVDLGLGIINGNGIYESTFDNSEFKLKWDENVKNFTLSCS